MGADTPPSPSASPLFVPAVTLAIALAGFLFWWNFLRFPSRHPRAPANEASAVALLRSIHRAETSFTPCTLADVDGDGKGEFGFLGELTAAVPVRRTADGKTRGIPCNPPLLDPGLAPAGGTPVLAKSGYLFRVFLPAGPSTAAREAGPGLPFSAPVDTDLAEEHWCAYGWPVTDGAGTRVFYIDERGALWARPLAGAPFPWATGPAFDDALPAGSPRLWTTGRTAAGPGNDGAAWTLVD